MVVIVVDASVCHLNSLLYGVPKNLLRNVQSLPLICGCDHIIPVLHQLHWLPVQRRVEFKIASIVHQSLALLAPAYLIADIYLISEYGRSYLHSSTNRTLIVLRAHNRFGDRSFAVV